MKLKFAVLPGVVFTSVLGCCHSGQANDTSVRMKLTGQYKQMAQAYKHKNLSGFMKPLADDFVMIDLDVDPQNRDAFAKSLKADFGSTLSVNKDSYRINKIIVGKSEAAVCCFNHMDCIILDKDGLIGRKGTVDRFIASGTSYDRWKNVAGTWKLEREEVLTSKMTMNGKPFTPKPITINRYFFNGKPVHSDFTPIVK